MYKCPLPGLKIIHVVLVRVTSIFSVGQQVLTGGQNVLKFINEEIVLSQMQCRFVVYSVPWEKRKDLLSHECVGLEEKIMTCERSNPVEAKSEPDENNMVKEILIEPAKVHVHVHCIWMK